MSILFKSILFCSILFYSILLYSILFCSIPADSKIKTFSVVQMERDDEKGCRWRDLYNVMIVNCAIELWNQQGRDGRE